MDIGDILILDNLSLWQRADISLSKMCLLSVIFETSVYKAIGLELLLVYLLCVV